MRIDWTKVEQPDIVFQRFPSRRSVVYGTKGIVAASQPLAVEAGLEILRKGGNAGSGQGIAGNNIPATNLNSVTVPGCAAAWVDTVGQLGSGNLSLADVLEPAIRLAEEGFPVSEINSFSYQRSESLLKNASPNGDEMLLDGKAPLPGQYMKLTNLAKTFREVATLGKDGFYKGRVAQAIVDLIKSKGGVMELEDLASHQTDFVEPIKYTFNGEVTVYEVSSENVVDFRAAIADDDQQCPPNGQGLTALLALGILDNAMDQGKIRSLLDMEHNSAEYLHALVETMRLAFADSQYYITDPAFTKVPVDELLSKEYLASRAKLIDPSRSNPEVVHGNPQHSSDTVYFTVADQWGNACSFIQSNYAGFGTGAIPAGCGFTLQNRGSNFNLTLGHPNVLEGGKRPYHTIIPAMALRNGDLFLSYGVMGGFMQPQGHVQVLLNLLRGFTVQAALDAPRFCISAGSPETESNQSGRSGDINSEVYFEEGIPNAVVETLRGMGHDARVATGVKRSMFGRGQIIQKLNDKSGKTVWAAGSDPRADGHAAAQI
uniref:Gamma-glutamyltranspeptidase (Ggt) n=1 Tax=Ganoderma boninense TaxID=34458 RepID=A0A5K1JSC7_9APHY|nr:Gamma-glutamyltranspeptidase (Ggt) [Ganoderma boninense]